MCAVATNLIRVRRPAIPPVADYLVVVNHGTLKEYFGPTEGDTIYTAISQAGFSDKASIHDYDPIGHRAVRTFFDSGVGQDRVYELDLPTDTLTIWQPESDFGSTAQHEIHSVSIISGFAHWLVMSASPALSGSPITEIQYRACRAPLGSIDSVDVLGSSVVPIGEIHPSAQTVQFNFLQVWRASGTTFYSVKERQKLGTTTLIDTSRMFTVSGGLVQTSPLSSVSDTSLTPMRSHPTTLTGLTLQRSINSALCTRGAGDVDASPFWPDWVSTLLGVGNYSISVASGQVVLTAGNDIIRAPLSGFGPSPTETFTVGSTLRWAGLA